MTLNCQSNLEKKKNKVEGITLPDFRLQSCSNQNGMVLAQKWTHRSMEQNRQPRNKPTHLPYLTYMQSSS